MIDQEALNSLFEYNSSTGILTRKAKTNDSQSIGEAIGCLRDDGYLGTKIFNKSELVHRIIWKMENGTDANNIDHINGLKSDNRIENMRSVTHHENMKNKRKGKNNKSGAVGVNWLDRTKKWVASIRVNKKTIHLGSFVLFHEAVNARKIAEVAYGFHENHGKEKI